MAATPEGRVKGKIRTRLKEWVAAGYPLWWFWPQAGPFGRAGVPDLVMCVGGHFLAVEVKAPGGKPTVLQGTVIDAILVAGGEAVCVDSVEAFNSVCQKYLEQTR